MNITDFFITSTYDPSNDTITCEPPKITVKKETIGKITVKLQVKEGNPGTISFPFSPIEWTKEPPSDFTLPEIVIVAPNTVPPVGPNQEYPFEINYVYTPPGGNPVTKTGDPTIILEGTGNGSYYPKS